MSHFGSNVFWNRHLCRNVRLYQNVPRDAWRKTDFTELWLHLCKVTTACCLQLCPFVLDWIVIVSMSFLTVTCERSSFIWSLFTGLKRVGQHLIVGKSHVLLLLLCINNFDNSHTAEPGHLVSDTLNISLWHIRGKASVSVSEWNNNR